MTTAARPALTTMNASCRSAGEKVVKPSSFNASITAQPKNNAIDEPEHSAQAAR